MTNPEDCKVESLKFGYNLTISLSGMLNSGALCDTTLVCSDGALKAHKVYCKHCDILIKSKKTKNGEPLQ